MENCEEKLSLRPAKSISKDERKELIKRFLKQREETKIGLQTFANENNISFYTLRDWYRSKEYNSEWKSRINIQEN